VKRINNLFEKIVAFENLLVAAYRAARGKKLKNSVNLFLFQIENEILLLREELLHKTYKPKSYFQFEVKEPKIRQICSSNFRDRVTHHAICQLIEPIFERRSIFDSYACRNDKGSHQAVSRCQKFAKQYKYYLKCDINKFFENIDHQVLKNILRRVFKDQDLLWLLDVIIDHKVPENIKGKGLPIGNLTSQHFANLYLGEFDHYVKERLQVKGYVRYMDDFICFSNSKAELWNLHSQLQKFVEDNLLLKLKARVTQVAPVIDGIPFLGFRIFPSIIRLKNENLRRLIFKIKKKESLYAIGELPLNKLRQSVNSMVAHVEHANSLSLRRKIFKGSFNLV